MLKWLRVRWLIYLIAALVVGDILYIWLGHLHVSQGIDLVSASFVAVAAIAAAIATSQTLEVSRKAEETAQHAAEALSRALLPPDRTIMATWTLRADRTIVVDPVVDQNGKIVVLAVSRHTENGDEVAARRGQSSTQYVFDDAPPNPTWNELRGWMKTILITLQDERRLATWRTFSLGGAVPVSSDMNLDERVPMTPALTVELVFSGLTLVETSR